MSTHKLLHSRPGSAIRRGNQSSGTQASRAAKSSVGSGAKSLIRRPSRSESRTLA
jgi:hypothetical protein